MIDDALMKEAQTLSGLRTKRDIVHKALEEFVRNLKKRDLREIPFGISPLIFLEVLQGAATEKDFRQLKEYLQSQAFYDLRDGRDSVAQAARISYELRRKGAIIRSSVDFLIAQTAIDNDLYLLHNDSDFERIKQVSRLKTWA